MINVACPVNSLGYGCVGTNTILGLQTIGHEPALWPIGQVQVETEEKATFIRRAIDGAQLYDPKAPSLRIFHQFALAEHVGRGIHAALPIFELDTFTNVEKHHLAQQDVVFASGEFAARTLEHNGVPAARIWRVSFGVDPEIFRPRPAKKDGPTVFLNVGKWEIRKGHDVLVDVFNKAFTKDDNVMLVMCCHNPCVANPTYNDKWTQLYKRSPLGDRISVIRDRFSSQRSLATLMGQADCGIFLSRAEGWNLDAAEMLAMGKQLVITWCTAHTEYCDEGNARLVDVPNMEQAFDGIWFHGQGRWAKLDNNAIEQAVEHMRDVHRLKQEGQLLVNQAGIDTMKRFTWERTAREIVAGLAG